MGPRIEQALLQLVVRGRQKDEEGGVQSRQALPIIKVGKCQSEGQFEHHKQRRAAALIVANLAFKMFQLVLDVFPVVGIERMRFGVGYQRPYLG